MTRQTDNFSPGSVAGEGKLAPSSVKHAKHFGGYKFSKLILIDVLA